MFKHCSCGGLKFVGKSLQKPASGTYLSWECFAFIIHIRFQMPFKHTPMIAIDVISCEVERCIEKGTDCKTLMHWHSQVDFFKCSGLNWISIKGFQDQRSKII